MHHHHKWKEEIIDIVFYRGSIILHMKSPIELKDNSILQNLNWSESWVLSAYMGSLSDVVLGPEWVLWHFDLHPFLRLSRNVVTT